MDVTVDPGFRCRRRIGPDITGIAMRKVHGEEMRFPLNTAYDDDGLAKIGLGVPGWVRQRHEHLTATPFALPHIILHDRVAADETVLIAKPLEHPLRRVPLLVMDLPIAFQPTIDDPGEGIQLWPLDRCRPPITGRDRERHHLPDAVARDIEMPRCFSLAHALSTGQPNLPIQVHGKNPPALPVTRKGKDARLLRRPQQAHPAATVANYRTAVLSFA